MPRIFTTQIADTECMGDSLVTINNNYENLDTAIQNLSSQTISITDTSTIDLTYDSGNRNLTASVKLSSLESVHLSPTFTLSASQISNDPNNFKTFGTQHYAGHDSTYYRSAFFISDDDTLWAAGYANGYYYGQSTGTNYLVNGWRHLMIPLDEGEFVREVHFGGDTAPSLFVLTNLGNIYSTGYNGYGQLGLGDLTTRTLWGKISLSNVVYFTVSRSSDNTCHCFAINSSGELYAWGYNGYGNLGLGDTANRTSPQRVNTGDITGLTLKSVYAFGHYGRGYVIDTDDNLYACGYNGYGQLGVNNTTNQNRFSRVFNNLKADYIASGTGSATTAFLVRNNELWACGYNGHGQLGQGDTTQRNSFTKINGISVDQITTWRQDAQSVAIVQLDGSMRVWGYNGYGQLGVGDTAVRTTPTTPSGNPQNVTKILGHGLYAGLYYLNSSGRIFSTGYNGYGNLGEGTTTQRTTFQPVIINKNIKFIDFSVFGYNTAYQLFAVDENKKLWSCGYNAEYSLAQPLQQNSVTVLGKTTFIS